MRAHTASRRRRPRPPQLQPPRRACVLAQVDGVALLKQVVIRVSDSNHRGRRHRDEDTATVRTWRRHYHATSARGSIDPFDHRDGRALLRVSHRGGQYAWRVTFTAGDCAADDVDCYVTVWPIEERREQGTRSGRRERGAWMDQPPGVQTDAATGAARRSANTSRRCCTRVRWRRQLPSNECGRHAFTQLEIDALRKISFASGTAGAPAPAPTAS